MENIVPFPNEDFVLDSIADFCEISRSNIQVHYMFKYHVLSLNGHAFAMVIDGRLALKYGNSKQLKERLLQENGQVVCDYSTVTKTMSYLSIHEDCSLPISNSCLELLKRVMYYWYNLGESPRVASIENMTNITKSLALSLHNIGIKSVDELKNLGSANAYHKLKTVYPDIPNSYYSRIEGALTNKHYMFVEEFYIDSLPC
ncbi:TfoX/Sxy family DNA transformation protein [Vibrio sp. 99-8-1]|uniref:TfoX/Sxy family DNA transformation protein n=1 Tax=Vibrio sp. 99-8-1 TaxID=2607602 RepID=UPI001493C9F9|nr:TfoX/Sxy family DNA transformation protein [Vibrio sp. 99-8-1]NOI67439.1 TfoX/Sxy family DNA transformation protein [Vibrio sp. 99-8-1]